MFGRENCLPVDLIYGAPVSADGRYTSLDEFVTDQQLRIRECYHLVRESLHRAAERAKRRYDIRVNDAAFDCGDQVWYFYPRRRVGLSPKWQRFYEGPYEV